MTRLYGRSLAGTRAYGECPYHRGENVSLIGGLSLRGLLALTPIRGAVNALTFEAFIAQRLVPHLQPGDCVVMDNARIHREAQLLEILKPAQVSLVFLPPYSPDFSPIENAWSKLKHSLRSWGARTLEQLMSALEQASDDLSLHDIFNWFSHCCCNVQGFEQVEWQKHPLVIG